MRFFSNPNNWTSGLKEMLLPYNMNTVTLVQHKFKILSFYTNCNTSSLLQNWQVFSQIVNFWNINKHAQIEVCPQSCKDNS